MEEDYGQEEGKPASLSLIDMGSEMEGGMVYQDEDGNLIMYNHEDMMGDEEDEGHDMSYGMEGSPQVSNRNSQHS